MAAPAPDPRFAGLFPALGRAGLADQLLAAAARVALPAGRSICREGAMCTHLPLVLAGSARVYKLGESGRELTLYRIGPGDSCVLTAACILSGRRFPALAAAETAIEVLAVPAQRVPDWLATWPEWRAYVFGLVAQRLADVIGVVEDVAFRRLDQRLADHLLLASGGRPVLPATHQQIADDIGTSREVVSRVLKDLEERGLVTLGRGQVRLLDTARLAALAAGR